MRICFTASFCHLDRLSCHRFGCGRLVEFLTDKDEVAAQISFADHLVGGQFLGRSLEQDLTFEEQIGTVDDGKGFRSIMVGDENADVLFL